MLRVHKVGCRRDPRHQEVGVRGGKERRGEMTGFSTSKKQREKFGIFSFFTGAGFLDLGFEDAGFSAVSGVFSHAETLSRRGGEAA